MAERGRSSDSGLPPSPPSRLAPVASWRGSVSPYSGGTVPDSHRVPSPCSLIAASLSSDGDWLDSCAPGSPSSPGRPSSSRSRPCRISGRGSAAGISCCASSRTRPSTPCSARSSCGRRPDPGSRSGSACCTRSATRSHQMFVPGRHGSPIDVAIDAVGVAVGDRALAVRTVASPRMTLRPAARDRPRRARRHAAALGRMARLRSRRAGGRSGRAACGSRRGGRGARRRGSRELAGAARALLRGSRARLSPSRRGGERCAAGARTNGRRAGRVHRRARSRSHASRSPSSARRGACRRSSPEQAPSHGFWRSSALTRSSSEREPTS